MTLFNKRKYIFTKRLDQLFSDLYSTVRFILLFLKDGFSRPFHFKSILHQCYEIGIKSLPLITLTGFIVGMVFTKQARPSLEDFGATSWLPSLMGIATIKALGPLVTALICAGKIGSGIGAELGSMKVTEQIEAMEVSSTAPFKYLVVTRIWATTVSITILVFYCSFLMLLGSYFNVHTEESSSMLTYFQNAFSTITFLDIFALIFKSVLYGFTIGIVGCYKGYHARQGTVGVGRAANQAVVTSMFLIFIEEVLVVQVAHWIRYF